MPPRVVEWYPTPKHAHQPRYFMPEQAQTQPAQWQATRQLVPQQAVPGGYVQQPVPQQVWMVPAVPPGGYVTGTGVPAQGGSYAPAPVWGQQLQPYQQPVQSWAQPAQQYYGQVPQQTYTQRPWGATDEATNSTRGGRSIDSWQVTGELPAWGAQPYGGYQSQSPGYYNVQPGTVQPGYYR